MDFLPSPEHHKEPELCTSSGHLHHPPPLGVQMSSGKSLLALESPILVESLIDLEVEQVTSPLPGGKILGLGGPGEISGTDPLMV